MHWSFKWVELSFVFNKTFAVSSIQSILNCSLLWIIDSAHRFVRKWRNWKKTFILFCHMQKETNSLAVISFSDAHRARGFELISTQIWCLTNGNHLLFSCDLSNNFRFVQLFDKATLNHITCFNHMSSIHRLFNMTSEYSALIRSIPFHMHSQSTFSIFMINCCIKNFYFAFGRFWWELKKTSHCQRWFICWFHKIPHSRNEISRHTKKRPTPLNFNHGN